MPYILKGEWTCDSRTFIPPVTFVESYLAIKAILPGAKTTWNKAADIYQFVDIPGLGKLISPKRAFLPLGRLVEISLASSQWKQKSFLGLACLARDLCCFIPL
jgi:hypothetical protein